MSCQRCFQGYLSCGISEIVVNTGVEEIAEYTVILTNKQAKYTNDLSSDVFGDITIPVSLFPENLLNPYAGKFTLQVMSGCDAVLFCGEYPCYEFEVVNGDNNKNTLSCCQSENPDVMSCCTTQSIIFTNEAITTVNYSGNRPIVEVAYLNLDGSFTLAGIGTLVTFNGSTITVDHGGAASGVIKLSR